MGKIPIMLCSHSSLNADCSRPRRGDSKLHYHSIKPLKTLSNSIKDSLFLMTHLASLDVLNFVAQTH